LYTAAFSFVLFAEMNEQQNGKSVDGESTIENGENHGESKDSNSNTSSRSSKKISTQEKFELMRKQHQLQEEEKLAKVKNDPSRKINSSPSAASIASQSLNSTTGSNNNDSNNSFQTPEAQSKKVSSLQNKWKEVLNESKSQEKSKFDNRKQATISQFRIAQEGSVKKRIGEWEQLFLQQSIASADQMEAFFKKAQAAMMENNNKRGSQRLVTAASPGPTISSSSSQALASSSSFDRNQVDGVATGRKSVKSEDVSPPLPPSSSQELRTSSDQQLSTSSKEEIETEVEVESELGRTRSDTTTLTKEIIIEDFIINDTRIYSLKEFSSTTQSYIMKCFKMNKTINRIPLLCGVFGDQSSSGSTGGGSSGSAKPPPIDVFSAAIKTSDDSIFIALTIIVHSENEQNSAVYGIKKIVIIGKEEEKDSPLIEKVLNIIPTEGMILPFHVPSRRSMLIEQELEEEEEEEVKLYNDDDEEEVDVEVIASKGDDFVTPQKNPSSSAAVPLASASSESMVSPFKGYLDKLFQSDNTNNSNDNSLTGLSIVNNSKAENEKKINLLLSEEGEQSSSHHSPMKAAEQQLQKEEIISSSLDAMERNNNSNHSTLYDSIQQLDDMREAIRSVPMRSIATVGKVSDGEEEEGEESESNGAKVCSIPGLGDEKVVKLVDVLLTKLAQCSKWKQENPSTGANKDLREVFELKLLSSLREIVEVSPSFLLATSLSFSSSASSSTSDSHLKSSSSSLSTRLFGSGNKEAQQQQPSSQSGSKYTSTSSSSSSSISILASGMKINEIIDRLKLLLKHSNYKVVKVTLNTIELLNEYYMISIGKLENLIMTINSIDYSSEVYRYLSSDLTTCHDFLQNTIHTITMLIKNDEENRDEIIDVVIQQLKVFHGYEFRTNRLTSSFDLHKLHMKPADKIRKGYEHIKGEGMRNKVKNWLLDCLDHSFIKTEKEYYLKKQIFSILKKECLTWKDTSKSISIPESFLQSYSHRLKAYNLLYRTKGGAGSGFYHHLVSIPSKVTWEPSFINTLIEKIFLETISDMDIDYLYLYYDLIVNQMMFFDEGNDDNTTTATTATVASTAASLVALEKLQNSLLTHYENVSFDSLILIPLECFEKRHFSHSFYNSLYLQYHGFLKVNGNREQFAYKYEQFMKMHNSKNIDKKQLPYVENMIETEFLSVLLSKFFLFRYSFLNHSQTTLTDMLTALLNESGEASSVSSQLIQHLKNHLFIMIGYGLLRYENNLSSSLLSSTILSDKKLLPELVSSLIHRINELLKSRKVNNLLSLKRTITEKWIYCFMDNYYITTESYSSLLNANYVIECLFNLFKNQNLKIKSSIIDYWIIGRRYPLPSILFDMVEGGKKDDLTSFFVSGERRKSKEEEIALKEFPFLFYDYHCLYQSPNIFLQTLLNEYLLLIKAFQENQEKLEKLQEETNNKKEEGLPASSNHQKEAMIVEINHLLKKIEKKLLLKKIELTRNILKFIELTNSIRFNNSTSTSSPSTVSSLASATRVVSIVSPLSPVKPLDIDSLFIFEENHDDENGSSVPSPVPSSPLIPLTVEQKGAIQQLKEACSVLLSSSSSLLSIGSLSSSTSASHSFARSLIISPDYLKQAYQVIMNHSILSFYYKIFYFEAIDYIYFIHYNTYQQQQSSNDGNRRASGLKGGNTTEESSSSIGLVIKKCFEKINSEFNYSSNVNLQVAFPLTAATSSTVSSSSSAGLGVYSLEYFIQMLTTELIFAQLSTLENMMENGPAEGGNGGKKALEKKRLSANPVLSNNEKLNVVELFAREQLQKLFGKVKNELFVEESLCQISYLPRLVEWTAGTTVKDEVIKGTYRRNMLNSNK
jgi:hypothetical protein